MRQLGIPLLFSALIAVASIQPTPTSAQDMFQKSKDDGRRCSSLAKSGEYEESAFACAAEADDFQTMALAVGDNPQAASTLFDAQAFALRMQSYALYHAGSKVLSHKVFQKGYYVLRAVATTPGCDACAERATEALREYGTWPVKTGA